MFGRRCGRYARRDPACAHTRRQVGRPRTCPRGWRDGSVPGPDRKAVVLAGFRLQTEPPNHRRHCCGRIRYRGTAQHPAHPRAAPVHTSSAGIRHSSREQCLTPWISPTATPVRAKACDGFHLQTDGLGAAVARDLNPRTVVPVNRVGSASTSTLLRCSAAEMQRPQRRLATVMPSRPPAAVRATSLIAELRRFFDHHRPGRRG